MNTSSPAMQALTYVLVVVGLTGMWVALRHPSGWMLIVIQGVLYVAYGALTRQGAFVFHGGALVGINARNFARAYAKKRRKIAKKAAKARALVGGQ